MIGPFCLETIVTDKLEFKVSKLVPESLRDRTHCGGSLTPYQ